MPILETPSKCTRQVVLLHQEQGSTKPVASQFVWGEHRSWRWEGEPWERRKTCFSLSSHVYFQGQNLSRVFNTGCLSHQIELIGKDAYRGKCITTLTEKSKRTSALLTALCMPWSHLNSCNRSKLTSLKSFPSSLSSYHLACLYSWSGNQRIKWLSPNFWEDGPDNYLWRWAAEEFGPLCWRGSFGQSQIQPLILPCPSLAARVEGKLPLGLSGTKLLWPN